MEWSVILLIIGVLLGVYLIFKLIKKVVFIVISLVVFFLVVVGAVFGIVYLDFKNLANQSDFDVQVIYKEGDDYKFGFLLPVENKEVNLEGLKKISEEDLLNLDVDSIEKDDNLYVIIIDSEFYNDRISDKTYSLDSIEQIEEFNNLSLDISGENVIEIFESENPEAELVDVFIEETNIPFMDQVKPVIELGVEKALEETNLGAQEIVFAMTLTEMSEDEKEFLYLAEGFKSEDIEIYPDRMAFSLIKMLPLDTIIDNVPTSESTSEE